MTGASRPGTLAYNSWLTMQAAGETDPDTCAYNDLALIRIDPADVGKVNPSVPGFGGPTGSAPSATSARPSTPTATRNCAAGVTKLSPKQGIVVQNEGDGWSHNVVTLTPGIPGDSGSGFLNESGGRSASSAPCRSRRSPARNGVGDLGRELAYLRANGGFPAWSWCRGREPFKADLLGAILGA